jgi:hypothetical protein
LALGLNWWFFRKLSLISIRLASPLQLNNVAPDTPQFRSFGWTPADSLIKMISVVMINHYFGKQAARTMKNPELRVNVVCSRRADTGVKRGRYALCFRLAIIHRRYRVQCTF